MIINRKDMIINQIVARGSNGEIGKEGKMLWHIPEDLNRFKAIRMGYPIIMGRKTWESIGKELKGSLNVVVTRDENYKIDNDNVLVFNSVHEAIHDLKEFDKESQCFIIGGGEIYKETLPFTDFIYLTEVGESFPDSDTFYPEINDNDWIELFNEQTVFKLDGFERGSTVDYKLLKRK